MPWTVQEIQHNASMLYNHVCSDDADRIYVDDKGHFQLDTRSSFWRIWTSLGKTSRDDIDLVAIRTLRRIVRAVKNGTLDSKRIIIQDRNPIGLFMDEGEAADSYEAIKEAALGPVDGPISARRPAANKKWIGRVTFGMNIGNASRFKAWLFTGSRTPDNELMKERTHKEVVALTLRLIHRKDKYIQTCGSDDYDLSDDEGLSPR